mgnify:CR=1 FL=1
MIELLKQLLDQNELHETPRVRRYISDYVECDVAIGKDHTATITLEQDAVQALNKLCTARQEFKKTVLQALEDNIVVGADGFRYYEDKNGLLDTHALRVIADHLEELNAEHQAKIDEHFESQDNAPDDIEWFKNTQLYSKLMTQYGGEENFDQGDAYIRFRIAGNEYDYLPVTDRLYSHSATRWIESGKQIIKQLP